jgi:4-hydroxy-2-oxoheptanedioate aldolase
MHEKVLAQGQLGALGVSLLSTSPAIEALGLLGVGWVLLDREHGTLDDTQASAMLAAAEAAGLLTLVRPASAETEALAQALASGAQGVLTPHVRDEADAHALVEATSVRRLQSVAVGADQAATLAGSAEPGEPTLLCVQIEDVAALWNLSAIVAVKGIDVVFIDPVALSWALGQPGRHNAPELVEILDEAVGQIRAAGKTLGIANDLLAAQHYLAGDGGCFYADLPTLLAWRAL